MQTSARHIGRIVGHMDVDADPWLEAETSSDADKSSDNEYALLQALVEEVESRPDSGLANRPTDTFCHARRTVEALDEDTRRDVTWPLAAHAHLKRLKTELTWRHEQDSKIDDDLHERIAEHPFAAVDDAELQWPLASPQLDASLRWSLADEVQAIIEREKRKRSAAPGKEIRLDTAPVDTAVTLSAAATAYATLLSLFGAIARQHAEAQMVTGAASDTLDWRNVLCLAGRGGSVSIPLPVLLSARRRLLAIYCDNEHAHSNAT